MLLEVAFSLDVSLFPILCGVSEDPQRMLGALELELQIAVSHTVGAGDWTLGPLQEPVPFSAETFLQLGEMNFDQAPHSFHRKEGSLKG